MTNLQKRVITALTTGSLLLQTALPAFAATTELVITGNGSDSTSSVNVEQQSTTSVVQNNVTSVNNDIKVNSNTGHNDANDNTGGNVLVDTGDSDTVVNVVNQLNSNVAEVESCDCENDTLVRISGNGTDSENEVNLESASATQLFQNNVAHVRNDVDVDADTGDNSAEDNTGGDVVIRTGDVDTEVSVATVANANSARVSGGSGSNGGSVTLLIEGNGSDSENAIDLALARAQVVRQDNLTSIRNDVDVEGSTGYNDADDNTGGLVAILTGDVDTDVEILNEAGFNMADVGCDCFLEDVMAKIAGNGTDSENEIAAEIASANEVFQSNLCGYGLMGNSSSLLDRVYSNYPTPCFDNDVEVDAQTGHNDAEDNTGDVEDDPMIVTGDSDTEVAVHNAGGSNVLGDAGEWEWPEMGSGVNLSFSFDLSDLIEWMQSH